MNELQGLGYSKGKPAGSIWEVPKFRRGLRYAGLYVLLSGMTFWYTNVRLVPCFFRCTVRRILSVWHCAQVHSCFEYWLNISWQWPLSAYMRQWKLTSSTFFSEPAGYGVPVGWMNAYSTCARHKRQRPVVCYWRSIADHRLMHKDTISQSWDRPMLNCRLCLFPITLHCYHHSRLHSWWYVWFQWILQWLQICLRYVHPKLFIYGSVNS